MSDAVERQDLCLRACVRACRAAHATKMIVARHGNAAHHIARYNKRINLIPSGSSSIVHPVDTSIN